MSKSWQYEIRYRLLEASFRADLLGQAACRHSLVTAAADDKKYYDHWAKPLLTGRHHLVLWFQSWNKTHRDRQERLPLLHLLFLLSQVEEVAPLHR